MNSHPYTLSADAVSLTYWDLSRYCAWLLRSNYGIYLKFLKTTHEHPSTFNNSAGVLNPAAVQAAFEQGEIDSLQIGEVHYAKPWAISEWVLRQLDKIGNSTDEFDPSSSSINLRLPELRNRINLACSWQELSLGELLKNESWSVRDIQELLWGRKLLEIMADALPIRVGHDEWESTRSQCDQDRQDMQRPIIEFVEAAIGVGLVADGGAHFNRYTPKTVVSWCAKHGIPLPEPLRNLASQLIEADSTEVLPKLTPTAPVSKKSAGAEKLTSKSKLGDVNPKDLKLSWRVTEEQLVVIANYGDTALEELTLNAKTKQGKLLLSLLYNVDDKSEPKNYYFQDLLKSVYPEDIALLSKAESGQATKLQQKARVLVNDLKKSMSKAGFPSNTISGLTGSCSTPSKIFCKLDVKRITDSENLNWDANTARSGSEDQFLRKTPGIKELHSDESLEE